MLYELILINEIEQRAKIFFLSVHIQYVILWMFKGSSDQCLGLRVL